MKDTPFEKNGSPKERRIEIRSDEMHDIISHIPGWLTRWGITLIGAFFLAFLLLSYFIKFPNIISAKLVITTSPQPSMLVSRTAGNLRLIKPDNSIVSQGEVVAYIQSNSTLEDVLSLEKVLEQNREYGYEEHLSGREFHLGDIQPYYTNLLIAANERYSFRTNDLLSKQIQQLNKQIRAYKDLSTFLVSRLEIAKEEKKLAYERFCRDSLLFAQNVIAAQDFNNARALYLQQLRAYNNAESEITANTIQVNTIASQITEIETNRQNQLNKLTLNVYNTNKELMAHISKWKQLHLFIAPLSGSLTYMEFLESDIYVESGKEIFSVIPESKEIYAQAEIPIAGSGRVKVNQEVNIRLANFPHQEFGMLRGKVVSISELPSNENYLARISLTNKMQTTFNKTLPFKQQLQGETEIITEDLRVLERIFYHFKSLLENSSH